MKRVLILCTGNSCRSQMAEALWNLLGGDRWSAMSAGSKPAGYVHPMALEVMRELGTDLSLHRSKHLDEFRTEPFDLVVTVCDNAQRSCPVLPGAKQTLHWPFEDPAEFAGRDDERLARFRLVRDLIREKIAAWLASESNGGT